MGDTRRVAVTGLGIVSSIGSDPDLFWSNALEGVTRIAPIPEHWRHYAPLHSSIWATLDPLDPEAREKESLLTHGRRGGLVHSCQL